MLAPRWAPCGGTCGRRCRRCPPPGAPGPPPGPSPPPQPTDRPPCPAAAPGQRRRGCHRGHGVCRRGPVPQPRRRGRPSLAAYLPPREGVTPWGSKGRFRVVRAAEVPPPLRRIRPGSRGLRRTPLDTTPRSEGCRGARDVQHDVQLLVPGPGPRRWGSLPPCFTFPVTQPGLFWLLFAHPSITPKGDPMDPFVGGLAPGRRCRSRGAAWRRRRRGASCGPSAGVTSRPAVGRWRSTAPPTPHPTLGHLLATVPPRPPLSPPILICCVEVWGSHPAMFHFLKSSCQKKTNQK